MPTIIFFITKLLKGTSYSFFSPVFLAVAVTLWTGGGLTPICQQPRKTRADCDQICDLANGDAYMWLSVNEIVLNCNWTLSPETLEMTSANGFRPQTGSIQMTS